MKKSNKNFLSVDDYKGMPKEITSLSNSESDRGSILVLSAYLEEILASLISEVCISDDEANNLLEFRGPAGGFSLKISLCYALGLINAEEKDALGQIRKIRNAAAHFDRKRGFDVLFTSDKTINHVSNLADSLNLSRPSNQKEKLRESFYFSVRILAGRLFFRISQQKRPVRLLDTKEEINEIKNRLEESAKGKEILEFIQSVLNDKEISSEERTTIFLNMLNALSDPKNFEKN